MDQQMHAMLVELFPLLSTVHASTVLVPSLVILWSAPVVCPPATATAVSGSGAAKISYSTNGGATYSTYNGTTYDGLKISSTCTIYAKTIDNAGNESVASDGYTVSIDKTKPTLGSLASTGTSSISLYWRPFLPLELDLCNKLLFS